MPLYDEIPPYDSDRYPPERTISVLRPYISDERFERMARVVSHRTRHMIPVVEGSYDVGNAMAILRTAEGLG
ncbi:MAG: TrmH family RNA methyltransferase, partial [Bacteroidota bacterium]